MSRRARSVDALIAERIAQTFTATELGHCARVDFFERQQIETISHELRQIAPTITIHLLGHANDEFIISTDRAIELRNRKQVRLCLFVPTDLVDAAFSSLANSFASIDGRELMKLVLKQLREELSREAGTIARETLNQLRRPLHISDSQKLDFCRTLLELEQQGRLAEAGMELWRVGLIPDRGSDFRARLDRNRRCVVQLALPQKLQASLSERIAATKVGPVTARALAAFFHQRAMNDHGAWSHALAHSQGPTFDSWQFPLEERSDLRQISLKSFVDRTGAVTSQSQLEQPDGAGGVLIARYGEGARGIKVGWTTDPKVPRNVGGWRVEIVPVDNPDQHELELPNRTIKHTSRSATLQIEFDDSDEEGLPDERFQVRLSATDQAGDPLVSAEDGADLVVLSEEFYIAKAQDRPTAQGKRETRPQTTLNLAIGRIEGALTRTEQLEEQEPLWSSSDLDYLRLKLTDRYAILIGMSRLLKQLEDDLLEHPANLGRYRLGLAEIGEATFDQVAPLPSATLSTHWLKFQNLRKQIAQWIRGTKLRNLVAIAPWDSAAAEQVIAYARAYTNLLAALAQEPTLREELGIALSVDTLLIITPKRGGGVEEAVVTLPTHPLRLVWYIAYQQLLAHWERQLLKLRHSERAQAIDLERLRDLTPANMPLVVYHPDASQPLIHTTNLPFFYGLALPSNLVDPQRRLADLARILGDRYGLEHEGIPSAMILANQLRRFMQLHPSMRSLSVTQINADRGELLTESMSHIFSQPEVSEDEEPELLKPPQLRIHAYVADDQLGSVQEIGDLRALFKDQVRFDTQSHLSPALSYMQRPIEQLRSEPPPDAHLAVACDIVQPQLCPLATDSSEEQGSSFSLYGLICRPLAHFTPEGQRLIWQQQLSHGGGTDVQHPVNAGLTDTLISTQIQIAGAISQILGGSSGSLVGLRVEMSDEQQRLLEQLHAQSGWVITIDRYIALDYYDSPHEPQLSRVAHNYLIDYTPEFTDGLSHRLVVTTAWRDEIEELLRRAMDELGFTQLESSVGRILDALKLVTGQLALQVSDLQHNAAAAVALGMVVLQLQRSGRLRDCILVPVDAAGPIFATSGEQQSSRQQRCDLALFNFSQERIGVTFIEVRWRHGGGPFEGLADDIRLQLVSSAAQLRSRYFAQPDRIDGPLQRARLANMLRFYLNRAQRHDTITPEHASSILNQLGRFEQQGLDFEPSYEGYIITPEGSVDQTITLHGATIMVRSIATLAPEFVTSVASDEEPDGTTEVGQVVLVDEADIVPGIAHLPTSVGTMGESTDEHDEERMPSAQRLPAAEERGEPSVAPTAKAIAIELGRTDERPILWQPSVQGSPHLFIIGIPGQGKSVALSNMLGDLLEQGVAPFVLDFHGEFAERQGTLLQRHGVRSFDAAEGLPFNPFEVMVRNGKLDWRENANETAEIFARIVELGGVQKDVLAQAIQDAYKAKGFQSKMDQETLPAAPSPADVLHYIAQREARRETKNLASRCRPLLEQELFNLELAPLSLREALRTGMIVDLHALPSEDVQKAAGTFLLHKLYREMFLWGKVERIRLVIMLDEVHRLAKDQTLPRIMKEGRKYGVAVVTASQSMSDFHPEVLNNASTKLLFRINYPESRRLAGYIGLSQQQRIEQLDVGEAYIKTPEMRIGQRVKMRPPRTPS